MRNVMLNRLAIIFLLIMICFELTGCATTQYCKSGSKNLLGQCESSNSTSHYEETGTASWYGKHFQHKRTASGEHYNMYGLTAAHKSLPLSSRVQVTNLRNGKKVILRVNDRGPFVRGRLIDVSYAAAKKLGMVHSGTAPVSVKVITLA